MIDLGQMVPGLLIGLGVGIFGSEKVMKLIAKRSGETDSSDVYNEAIAKLQSELEAMTESQSKVNEVHEYARTLETKIQELESTSDSADSELRVKVLEKQLSEKADLESKLAVAQQQLEDYKAKAEMYDTVVGTAPVVEAEPAPAALEEAIAIEEPEVIEPAAEEEPVIEEEPVVVQPAAEAPVEEEPIAEPVVAEEPVVGEEDFTEVALAPLETVASEPAVEEDPVEEPLIAVAADQGLEITLVENEVAAKGPASPVGATAPAIDERPALRIETTVSPILEAKDPLEKIEGIGQVYQTKLYEAGIKTFAQLAAASPSRITEVIEPQNWQQIDVMKWRREAALFASGEKS